MLFTVPTGNILIAVCAAMCTAEMIEAKALQMQHNS